MPFDIPISYDSIFLTLFVTEVSLIKDILLLGEIR